MTGSLAALFIGMLGFAGTHVLLSSRAIRDAIVARIGERPFLGIYSLVAALTLYTAVRGYIGAPYIELWLAPTGIKHITLTAMLLAAILVAASVSRDNPGVAGAPKPRLEDGPKGIFRITRHPFMWGVALWAMSHMMANGDAASQILFGGLAVLALGGSAHSDTRKARTLGGAWQTYAAQSSHVPFAAAISGRTRIVWSEIGWRPVIIGVVLYMVLLILHEPIIGIAPMSLVSGLFG